MGPPAVPFLPEHGRGVAPTRRHHGEVALCLFCVFDSFIVVFGLFPNKCDSSTPRWLTILFATLLALHPTPCRSDRLSSKTAAEAASSQPDRRPGEHRRAQRVFRRRRCGG